MTTLYNSWLFKLVLLNLTNLTIYSLALYLLAVCCSKLITTLKTRFFQNLVLTAVIVLSLVLGLLPMHGLNAGKHTSFGAIAQYIGF